jgi:hypothetical protein
MTHSEIAAIQLRLAATTSGSWRAYVEGRDHFAADTFIMTGIAEGEEIWSETRGEDIYLTGANHADIDFIAHARQDIPALLAYIAELEARLTNANKNGRMGDKDKT